MQPEALPLPFIWALHKTLEAAFGSINLPNRENCPQKEPFPQLNKIRGTVREKWLSPAPDYWQTCKATQPQGLEQKPSSPLTFPIQSPAFLFTVLPPPNPEISWNGVPVADACNFRALLCCWWVASATSLPPVQRRKITWRTRQNILPIATCLLLETAQTSVPTVTSPINLQWSLGMLTKCHAGRQSIQPALTIRWQSSIAKAMCSQM